MKIPEIEHTCKSNIIRLSIFIICIYFSLYFYFYVFFLLLLLLYLFIFNGTELSHGDRFPLLKEVRPERSAYNERTSIYTSSYTTV